MMDLPLAVPSAPTSAPGARSMSARPGHTEAFADTLTALLGDAGDEVVQMVEALEALTLQSAERDRLATVGWPMPAVLAVADAQSRAGGSAVDVGSLLEVLPAGALVDGSLVDGAAGGAVQAPVDPDSAATGSQVSVSAAAAAALAVLTATAGQSDGDGNGPAVRGSGSGAARPTSVTTSSAPATGVTGGTGALAGGSPAGAGPGSEATFDTGNAAAERVVQGAGATGRAAAAAEPVRVADGGLPSVAEAVAGSTDEARATQAGLEGSRRVVEGRAVGVPAAVQRILDAVDRLESMPPPRQLTLEFGEVRLRIGLEDGHVRLTLLQTEGDAGDELLREAQKELSQRGFDLGADSGGRSGAESGAEDEESPPWIHDGSAAVLRPARPSTSDALRL